QPIQNLSQIIDAFRVFNPSVKIVLAQIFPTTRVPTVTTQAYNASLATLAKTKTTRQSPVITVDQFSGFNPATGTYDGIHPTPPAEQQMASRFFTALKRLLP
ncbi:MAG: cellulose-binding protein, partial [Bacillota bacterium]